MGFSGYTSCKKSHYYDRRPIALSSSNARFSLPFGPVFANAGVCGGGMAGEDRFPPHLSPFAKVITEVGSGAKADIDQRQGCRAQAARIRVSEWANRLPCCQCRLVSAGALRARQAVAPGADGVTGRTVPCRGRAVAGVRGRPFRRFSYWAGRGDRSAA